MEGDRTEFARILQQEVLAGASVETGEMFREDKFTELAVEYLVEAGEIDGPDIASHRARGMQVNGYEVSEDESTLSLLVTEYSGEVPSPSLTRTAIQVAFRRLMTFLTRCLDGHYQVLEEASPVYDMALRIHEVRQTLTRVRLFLLSDMVAVLDPVPDGTLGGVCVTHHIWDIERLYRLWSSGRERETIEIDFQERFGQAIPCLMMPDASPDYATYLSVFPATVMVGIYTDFGNRLLERNVRSYLQARGKINSEMRRTILGEPGMFLAFNNGISVTAEAAEVIGLEGGGHGIRAVRDFQIVNGGQTTASLYQAAVRDRSDLAGVGVQVKLTVIKDPEKMDSIVPRISRYANSQNRIQAADLSANDPFHRAVEEHSRTIWAPAADGTQRQTRWYYERARGQYQNDRERESTPARKRQFDLIHPGSQKFTKTDLAMFENTWNMLPHIVSRGAERNFQDFMVRLQERGGFQPDQEYFEHLVAKAILFNTAVKLVHAQRYGGYRRNIVTYTLARLANMTAQCINLEAIWNAQALSPTLRDAIVEISQYAQRHIVQAPGNGNVTEWCKREECWKRFLETEIPLPEALKEELIVVGSRPRRVPDRGAMGPDQGNHRDIERVLEVPGTTWFSIAAWAKETGNLQSWQRSLAFSLGRIVSKNQKPSWKQAKQGIKILEEARRLGFCIATPGAAGADNDAGGLSD